MQIHYQKYKVVSVMSASLKSNAPTALVVDWFLSVLHLV